MICLLVLLQISLSLVSSTVEVAHLLIVAVIEPIMCVHFELRREALKATVAAMLDTAARVSSFSFLWIQLPLPSEMKRMKNSHSRIQHCCYRYLQSFVTESEMDTHNRLDHDDKKICNLCGNDYTSGSEI